VLEELGFSPSEAGDEQRRQRSREHGAREERPGERMSYGHEPSVVGRKADK